MPHYIRRANFGIPSSRCHVTVSRTDIISKICAHTWIRDNSDVISEKRRPGNLWRFTSRRDVRSCFPRLQNSASHIFIEKEFYETTQSDITRFVVYLHPLVNSRVTHRCNVISRCLKRTNISYNDYINRI